MEESKYNYLKLKVNNTYQYLQAMNGVFKLTTKELKILTGFIDLGDTVDLCSPSNKKKVAEALGMDDYNTLNNYVKRLKDKKVITRGKDGYELHKLIKPYGSTTRIDIERG